MILQNAQIDVENVMRRHSRSHQTPADVGVTIGTYQYHGWLANVFGSELSQDV